MEAKLIKKVEYSNDKEIYYSLIANDKCIGTTHNVFNKEMKYSNGDVFFNKLSLKNCQAIERGYDVNELADKYYGPDDYGLEIKTGFIKGFEVAMRLMGDKKFSEEDMRVAYNDGMGNIDSDGDCVDKPDDDFNDTIQSLQQTEWDCSIDMKEIQEIYRDGTTKYERVPVFDADGCLILKRK